MQNILNKCKRANKIVIYGAGTIADIFYFYLKQNKLEKKVYCFVVTKLVGNSTWKFEHKTIEFNAQNSKLFENKYCVVAVQSIFQPEIVRYLEDSGVREYGCVNSEKLLSDFYNNIYKNTIVDNKIFFQNQDGQGYGGNPKYLAEKLIEKDKNNELDLVWAVSEVKEAIPATIRQVIYGSEEYYYELGTSRVWIDNNRKAYSIRKRKGQLYIQTWHGAAPIKKVEADAEDVLPEYYIESAKNDSKMADIFLSGSEFYTNLYKKSFWYNGTILKFGLPRHDVFWNKKSVRDKIYAYYKIDRSESIVLYAPTFRTNYSVACYDLDINRVVKALERKFDKSFKMMVSRHPINNVEYEFDSNAKYIDVGDYEDFQELLAAADILITDYSGCMYDFSFTNRPVFLYQKDYAQFLEDRNFYISMEELPYRSAHSNDDLIKEIEIFDQIKYEEDLRKFMNLMGNYDSGNASELVVNYLLEQISN